MKKTFVITLIAALLLSSFAFFNIASAAMPFELPTPHYFGPYPNYATSQLPTVTYNPDGSVASATGGIRKFIDSLAGLGPAGVNNLGNYIPVAVADTVTYSGADYYEIAVVEFKQKFHTDIPLTTLRGYVQISTSVVPGAHTPLTYLNGTAIRLPNGNLAFGVDIPRYLGPTIVADKDKPVRIKFYNLLPAGMGGELFLPTDTSVMGAGMGPTPMMDGEGNPMLNPDGSIMYEMYSQNRATLHLHGGNTPWISDGTAHQWITPAGEDTAYPKGVSVYNVPDMPDPGPGAMTFYYTNQQSARLLFYHDHSYGITRLNVYAGEAAGYIIRDQIEQALITAGIIPADEIPLVIQDKTFVPDNTVPYTNMWGTFASQLAFQDPTWSVTKYGGPGSLWYPHVYVPMQNPGDPGGMNLIGRWQYSPWFWPPFNPEHPPVPNPYYIGGPLYDPAYPFNDLEPPMNPGTPNPSMPGEAFMDTPIVNGVAYPYLNVAPKAYRFRILSAADDRAFNLQMYIADNTTLTWDGRANTEVKMVPATFNATFPASWPTDGREGGVPDPAYRGPEFIQIGNEAGFLPAPAVLPNQPVNWNWDQGTFDFAIVNQMTLMLAPAERADVIVDFSQYAGKTIILYNDSPAPVPAADPRLDYYTGHPDTEDSGGSPSTIAGYGSNIRTVMQIRVAAATPAAPYDVDALNAAFASTPTTEGAFEAAQKTTIVPQAAYSSAYNQTFPDTIGSIFSTSLTFSPIGGSSPVTIPLQSKSIHDEMGGTFDMEYGRMEVKMGVEIPRSSPMTQTTILYGFADPPVDLIRTSISGTQIGSLGDGTQIWRITHNGVDTHPMHWHMYDVQVINRVAWDNNIRMPDANELGWKDTVRINPLQDTYIALRPIVPDIPFDLPNNIRPLDPTMPLGAVLADSTAADLTGVGRIAQDPNGEMVDIINHNVNFGWEYTWHCHILAHEEMDAMRAVPIGVRPRAPSSMTATAVPGGVQLFWFDNSLSETQFTIERATNPGFTTALTTFVVGENIRTYYDTTANPSQSYYYRVKATNVIGDTWDYNNPNINEGASFPTITMESTPSNTASVVDTVVKRYDFGTTTSPLETGYTRVSTTTSYSAPAGYGWDSTGGLQSRDRGAPDNLRRDFVMSTTDRTFRVDLPNGIYQVSVIVGDQTTWHGTMEIYAEGTRKTSITTSSPAQFEQRTFTVTITDGQLNLQFHGVDYDWLINAVIIQTSNILPSMNFDFGTATSPVETGYTRVSTNVYAAGTGYGWNTATGLQARDRGAPDYLKRDFVMSTTDHTFIVDLPNGNYQITLTSGDQNYYHDPMDIFAEGTLRTTVVTNNPGQYAQNTFTVTITDGQLNLLFHNEGNLWLINAITIQPSNVLPEINYDFGSAGSPVQTGYARVTTAVYSAGTGYGWNTATGLQARDRGAPDNLRRDFIMSLADNTFMLDLPNGDYQITVIVGDQNFWHGTMDISAEGTLQTTITTSTPAQFEQRTFTVTITDGQLNLLFHSYIDVWLINAITIQTL